MLYVESDGTVKITRGDTARLTVSITNSITGTAYIMNEEDVLTMTVKKNIKDMTACFIKTSTGVNNFKLDPSDTKTLPFGKYIYDVQLTTETNEVYTVIEPSKFIILEEVSQ